MPNRLADAISPYLRSHAGNPVDWFAWGEEAFAEATRRDVPLLVSIGYSSCHWCHVMARESFSDPLLAAELNARFVAVKVDREEYPDVDASYLTAASAFTRNLGWPLTVFVTPEGTVFYAGTYYPPEPRGGQPSLRQVLDAVSEAWIERRDEVHDTAAQIAQIVAAAAPRGSAELPGADALDAAVGMLREQEDGEFGGFGRAPKFPVAPALGFLSSRAGGSAVAQRALEHMASSPLRDPVEGGFFRYAVRRDWSEPHYERMLYDNALLLRLYAEAAVAEPHACDWALPVAEGIASFLLSVMLLPGGGFASAQDSESFVGGVRVEGSYYRLDAAARAEETPPALDEKVLTGWNGLALGALAHAGFLLDRAEWVEAAVTVADTLLSRQRRPDGSLARASVGDRVSEASATLEDYGMLANGLLDVATATGDSVHADAARELVDATMTAADGSGASFAVPGGADAVLAARGLAIEADPSEGAYPSGWTATASAAHRLYRLGAGRRYDDAARAAMRTVASPALESPISFGAALELMTGLVAGAEGASTQLVVVVPDLERGRDSSDGLVDAARRWSGGALVVVVTEAQAVAFASAGFELFAERTSNDGLPTAYLCHDFVCRLPVTDAAALAAVALAAGR